jgi:UPF0755 protein
MVFKKIHHSSRWKKTILIWVVIVLCIGFGLFLRFYQNYFRSNINDNIQVPEFIYIPSGAKYNDVLSILDKNNLLANRNTFLWLAKQLNYRENIFPGKYKIEPGMSNYDLIKMLKGGYQTPVKLVIGKFRVNHQFRTYVSKNIEPDSTSIQIAFDKYLMENKIDTSIIFKDMTGYVIQNTYEFYWNTSAENFWDKLFKEYHKFWNTTRLQQAKQHGLNAYTATILASIVEEETSMNDEKPTIAGVYLNRLRKKIPLQADPTVRFALHDFAIKRVLFTHLKTESVYNTYAVSGLPPGPICIPTKKTIDAVLNAATHNYIYFCAREDFSGYHNFAIDYKEHEANAKRYQKAYIDRFVLHKKIDTTTNISLESSDKSHTN